MPIAGGKTPWQACLGNIAAEAIRVPPIAKASKRLKDEFSNFSKNFGFIEAAVQLHGLEPLSRMWFRGLFEQVQLGSLPDWICISLLGWGEKAFLLLIKLMNPHTVLAGADKGIQIQTFSAFSVCCTNIAAHCTRNVQHWDQYTGFVFSHLFKGLLIVN